MVSVSFICYTCVHMKSLHLSRPYAMMMVGIPGSGKSHFAEKFSGTFQLPYIDSLILEGAASDANSASRMIGYVLSELSKTGKSFVFEGNSDSRTRRTEFATWARAHGYTPLFIWVQTDQSTALARTIKAKTLTREQFSSLLKDFSPPHEIEKAVVISGKHTYASQAKAVLKRLADQNRPMTSTSRERAVASPPSRPELVR